MPPYSLNNSQASTFFFLSGQISDAEPRYKRLSSRKGCWLLKLTSTKSFPPLLWRIFISHSNRPSEFTDGLLLWFDKVIVWQKMESFLLTVWPVRDVFYQFPTNTGNCHIRGQFDILWEVFWSVAVAIEPSFERQQSWVGQVVAENVNCSKM